MRIAVTTPRGNVGRHVVRSLVRAGVRPRLLSRSPEREDEGVLGHVDVATVDLSDPDSVVEATRGVDALHAVVPSPAADDPVAEIARIGQGLARAVEVNGIARTVFQSSIGAELRHGVGEIDGLAAVECALDDVVEGHGGGVLHLRCGFFFTNLLHQLDAMADGTVPVLWPEDHPLPWVAPRDIAEVATSWLLRPDWSGRHVQAVHGPADLSWRDAMAIVSESIGRTVTPVRMPDDAIRQQLASVGLGPRQIDALLGMTIGLRDGYTPEQPRSALTTTGTTLGAWAYDVLRPLMDT